MVGVVGEAEDAYPSGTPGLILLRNHLYIGNVLLLVLSCVSGTFYVRNPGRIYTVASPPRQMPDAVGQSWMFVSSRNGPEESVPTWSAPQSHPVHAGQIIDPQTGPLSGRWKTVLSGEGDHIAGIAQTLVGDGILAGDGTPGGLVIGITDGNAGVGGPNDHNTFQQTISATGDGKGEVNTISWCSSPIGKNPILTNGTVKYQPIYLARGCRVKSIIAHEIGHALGMVHEQSRPDRDDYLSIVWTNVKQSMRHNFQKFNSRVTSSRDVPYDYTSIMHYGSSAFSENGSPTMRTKNAKYQDLIGKATRISFQDALVVNLLYKCHSNTKPIITY